MSTQLFFRSTLSDVNRGEGDVAIDTATIRAWAARKLSLDRGPTMTTLTRTSIAGPAWIEVATTAEWLSDPIDRDIVFNGSSDSIVFNLWGIESSMNANANIACIVQGVAPDGTLTLISDTGDTLGTELGTSATLRNTTRIASPATIVKGSRIRVRVYFMNAPSVTMGAGFTLTFQYDHNAAANQGDSYVTLPQDIGFMVDTPGTEPIVVGTGATDATMGDGAGADQLAVNFMPTADGTITSVDVSIRKTGAPTDNVEVALQADASGAPSGTDLAVATRAGSTITTALANYNFNWTDVAVQAGKIYYIIVRRSGANDAANYYRWETALIQPDSWQLFFASSSWSDSRSTTHEYHVYITFSNSTLYLTDTAGGVDPNGSTYDSKEAWTSRGAGVQTAVRSSAAGPVAAMLLTKTAGGNFVEWFTRPLTAFTLSRLVYVNAWCQASSANVNNAAGCEIAVVDNDGTNPVIWGEAVDALETSVSDTAMHFIVSGDDLSVTDGQRLRIRLFLDDATAAGTFAAAGSNTVRYAGTSAAATGDTYIILPSAAVEFASGTGWTVTVTDAEGATDSRLKALGTIQTDAVGELDSLARLSTFVRTKTDVEGLLDPLGRGMGKFKTDPIGLLDPLTDVLGATRSPSDTIGILDSRLRAFDRTKIDPLGILDSAVRVATYVRVATDAEGLLDSRTRAMERTKIDAVSLLDSASYLLAAPIFRTSNDVVGILDQVIHAAVMIRSPIDPVGLSDTRLRIMDRSRTDPIGILDSAARVATYIRTKVDPIGLLDSVSRAMGQFQTDNIGILDSFARVGQFIRLATDPIGLLDSIVRSAVYFRSKIDIIGLLDSVVKVNAPQKIVNDLIGLLDSISRVATYARPTTDLIGLLDSRIRGYGKFPTEVIGLTDSRSKGYGKNPTDVIGLLDSRLRGLGQGVTDNIGLLDVITRLSQQARSKTDLIGLLDSATDLAAYARLKTDPVGILDSSADVLGAVRSKTDPIGILDSSSKTAVYFRTKTELMGIVDSFLATGTGATTRSATDSVGILDPRVKELVASRTKTDTIGLADSRAVVLVIFRSQVDPIALLDIASRVAEYVRTIIDALGLSDVLDVFTGVGFHGPAMAIFIRATPVARLIRTSPVSESTDVTPVGFPTKVSPEAELVGADPEGSTDG